MKYPIVGLAALAAVALAGCGESGGGVFSKTLPDETQVIDGPSLALPPSFELRPPRKAEDYETMLRIQKQAEAQALVTGVSGTAAVSGSVAGDVASDEMPAGDAWLLKQTGAQAGVAADPNVRQELEEAAKAPEDTRKQGLLKRWFGKDKAE